jgi:hypothetical protein
MKALTKRYESVVLKDAKAIEKEEEEKMLRSIKDSYNKLKEEEILKKNTLLWQKEHMKVSL